MPLLLVPTCAAPRGPRSLQHPHIVQYLGTEVQDQKLLIFTEWVSGGSIQILLQQFGKLAERIVMNFTRQVLVGLAFLHSRGVVHCDIKVRP